MQLPMLTVNEIKESLVSHEFQFDLLTSRLNWLEKQDRAVYSDELEHGYEFQKQLQLKIWGPENELG